MSANRFFPDMNDSALDWFRDFKLTDPPHRNYKILQPQNHEELIRLETAFSIRAIWKKTIVELSKTYRPELDLVGQPFCVLERVGSIPEGTSIVLAFTGAIGSRGPEQQARALYGNYVVAIVAPEVEAELEADLKASHHNDSSNLITAGFDYPNYPRKVKEYPIIPTIQSTKPLALLSSPAPGRHFWKLSSSEKAFADRVFGSLEAAFKDYWQDVAQAAKWRIGRIDITKHRRAKSFEEMLKLDRDRRFRNVTRLIKALHDYRYPYMGQRLITPALYRQFKKVAPGQRTKASQGTATTTPPPTDPCCFTHARHDTNQGIIKILPTFSSIIRSPIQLLRGIWSQSWASA